MELIFQFFCFKSTNHLNTNSTMKKLIVILIVTFISVNLVAQEGEQIGDPHWYTMFSKVPTTKLDTLKKLVKEFSIPFFEELKTSGIIIDYHFLFHHTGDEYTVVQMTKHRSWNAINDYWKKQFEAFEKFEPDEDKRNEIMAAFQSVFKDVPHIDNIYTELK